MSIILFFIILVVLVLAHEFGHFTLAKLSGMKVEQFGFGFPPKIASIKKGETEYSFNALPFGGFVKILGEDPQDLAERCLAGTLSKEEANRSFTAQNRFKQSLVLLAGIFFNFILAWFLLSAGFMVGMPTAFGGEENGSLKDRSLMILNVLPDSPAALAGLKAGDKIISLDSLDKNLTEEAVQNFIATRSGKEIKISFERKEVQDFIFVTPKEGVIADKAGIGISMALVGIRKLSFFPSIWEGLKSAALLTVDTANALVKLIGDALRGVARLDSLTGPVGLVSVVGDAFQLGFVQLIALTALISINLAIINLLPFPALDGGRFFIVLIEAISGLTISPKVLRTVNALGFVFLIFLMILVTFHDISRLF